MNEILNTIGNIGLEIVAAAVIVGIGVLFAWIELKIGKNKNLTNINLAKAELKDATIQTVGALKQKFADVWKEINGGKLTEEQAAKLRADLVDLTLEKMSVAAIKVLEAAKVDAIAYIQDAGEAFIERLNAGEPEVMVLSEIMGVENAE